MSDQFGGGWLATAEETGWNCGRFREENAEISTISRIVIAKVMSKSGFSTRKLARKLTAKGHPISKTPEKDSYSCTEAHEDVRPAMLRQTRDRHVEVPFPTWWRFCTSVKKAQDWCRENLPSFWLKEQLPGYSPELSPIEKLRSKRQDKLDKKRLTTTGSTLSSNLKMAWDAIPGEILGNIVSSMSKRMKCCVQTLGGIINH